MKKTFYIIGLSLLLVILAVFLFSINIQNDSSPKLVEKTQTQDQNKIKKTMRHCGLKAAV